MHLPPVQSVSGLGQNPDRESSLGASEDFDKLLNQFRTRRLAILDDDSLSPSRAVLVAPAQDISPSLMNEILALSGGLTFVALSPSRARAFLLDPMTRPRTSAPLSSTSLGNFALSNSRAGEAETLTSLHACTSVEAREGVSTGISAADRALTASILGEEVPVPRKLVRPGHIFPLETREGGVLVKVALTEGAVDMVRLAGFTEAAVCVDLLNSQGDFMPAEQVSMLAKGQRIPQLSLSALTRARLEREHLVEKVTEAELPTRFGGEMRAILFRSKLHDEEHLALVKGTIDPEATVLVRVQPEFTFGDVFGGHLGSTKGQVEKCLEAIGQRGSGVLLYLRRSFSTQLGDQLPRTAERNSRVNPRLRPAWAMREYGLGAQILRDLGVRKAEILTGSKRNLVGLNTFGIQIVAQVQIPT